MAKLQEVKKYMWSTFNGKVIAFFVSFAFNRVGHMTMQMSYIALALQPCKQG